MVKETYEINYQDKLNNFRNFVKEDISGNCIDFLQSKIEEAKTLLSGQTNDEGEDLDEVLIRTISKDLSRYYDGFEKYQKALSEMKTESLKVLRKKLVTKEKDFFQEVWGEESDNFFRTRKFISTYLKDSSISQKLNSTLDCISVSLYRYVYNKYGK